MTNLLEELKCRRDKAMRSVAECKRQIGEWNNKWREAEADFNELDDMIVAAVKFARAKQDLPAPIIEAPAPEQDAGVETEEERVILTPEQFGSVEDMGSAIQPAPEQDASVEIEPSPYAEAIEKGAITQDEADFLVSERERIAADEQAKFFAQGMMADADRHQSDQRGIVGTIASIFKREREDA